RQAGAVVVVDVPVDLGQVALVLQVVAGGHAVAARLHAQAGGDVDRAGDLVQGHVAVGHAVGQAGPAEVGDRLLLVGGEEEQAVLDDRAAEGHAAGLVGPEPVVLLAVDLADHAAGVLVGVVHRAVELVGAR